MHGKQKKKKKYYKSQDRNEKYIKEKSKYSVR